MREKRKLKLAKIKIAKMNGILGGDETTTVVVETDSCPTNTPGCNTEYPGSDIRNPCSDTCPYTVLSLQEHCVTYLPSARC